MIIIKFRDFIFESNIKELDLLKKQLLFNETFEKKKKDLLLLATKLIDLIADPTNAKEYYNSYLKKKKYKKW